MPRPRRPASKAGRNERRKLTAATLNGLGLAAVLGGYVQPVLVSLHSGRPLSRIDSLTALIFSLLGLILHLTAQAVAARLED